MAEPDAAAAAAETVAQPQSHPTFDGDTEEEDPDSCPQSKRRKNCPKALEKIEELVPSNQSYSDFTFDTKSSACGPEVTPKFGSFNSVKEAIPLPLAAEEKEKEEAYHQVAVEKKEEEQEQEEEEQEREVVDVLRVIDEIE